MKSFWFIILVITATGCKTHSKCEIDLYQSYYASAADAYLTLKLLDRNETRKAQTLAVSTLQVSLSELRKLAKNADSLDLDRHQALTSRLLKYSETNKAALAEIDFSLPMLTELKRMLTDESDIRRVTDIIEYVNRNSTNQFEPFDP